MKINIFNNVLVFLSIVLLSCSAASQDKYTQTVLQDRAAKDSAFSIAGETPIPEEILVNFQGLSYFAVNPDYKVTARLELNPDPIPFEMPTSTDRRPLYIHYATAHFTLYGIDLKLNVYQNQELIMREGYENHLFIPFRDLACPEECYGGGRYLDVEKPEGGTLEIDFNLAYNPYCAYNHKYSCPIPPEANSLNIAILAGEKKFEESN